MRISELLLETASDERAIRSIARSVYDGLKDGHKRGLVGTIRDITGLSSSEPAIDRLLDVNLSILPKLSTNASGTSDYSGNEIQLKSAGPHNFYITTLIHELRHMLDAVKSRGHFQSGKRNKGEYLQRPLEINARFSEAVTQVIKELDAQISDNSLEADKLLTDSNLLHSLIHYEFIRRRIGPELFPKGKNDPYYRKLFSRAYKMVVDHINKIEDGHFSSTDPKIKNKDFEPVKPLMPRNNDFWGDLVKNVEDITTVSRNEPTIGTVVVSVSDKLLKQAKDWAKETKSNETSYVYTVVKYLYNLNGKRLAVVDEDEYDNDGYIKVILPNGRLLDTDKRPNIGFDLFSIVFKDFEPNDK